MQRMEDVVAVLVLIDDVGRRPAVSFFVDLRLLYEDQTCRQKDRYGQYAKDNAAHMNEPLSIRISLKMQASTPERLWNSPVWLTEMMRCAKILLLSEGMS